MLSSFRSCFEVAKSRPRPAILQAGEVSKLIPSGPFSAHTLPPCPLRKLVECWGAIRLSNHVLLRPSLSSSRISEIPASSACSSSRRRSRLGARSPGRGHLPPHADSLWRDSSLPPIDRDRPFRAHRRRPIRRHAGHHHARPRPLLRG